MNFEQFFYAIAQQESSGRYGAVGVWVNGHRAYGKYQVMDFNIPSWTARHYGRRLTPQQFLTNPRAQDAVARGVLRSYVSKYGYRGAASAWYSGNPSLHMSTRSQPGGPSIKGYVDSVLARARRAPSGGGSSASASAGGAVGGFAGGGTKMSRGERAEKYGLSLRMVNSNKELKRLFEKASNQSWSPARFTAALKNTKWWRTQSKDLRQYITLKVTDPATWKQNRDNARAKIKRLGTEVGLKNIPGWVLRDAVWYQLAQGWSDARVRDWLGSRVKTHGGVMYGEAGEVFDRLHEIAYRNGMKYSDWYESEARRIVSGKSTLAEAEAKIRRQAAARWDPYAEQIKAGMDAIDLAEPYIQAVSEILELPQSDVDLTNKWVINAMSGSKGGSTYPLWEFETAVRGDERWRQTNNARESMMTTARQVLKDFGVGF